MSIAMESTPYRSSSHPPASTRADVKRDTPELCELLDMSKGYLLLYTKSCPSFDDVGGIWNLQHKGTPWAIARCLNAAAVQIVVKFASDQQAKTQGPIDPRFSLVVRSGGHDMHCRSAGANSLVLDIRGLDSITLATDHRFVTIGGGVTTGNLSQFLDEYKLTSTPGLCNTVGVTGFATGGGYSVISGTYGLGVDQIIGGKLVTPTGLLIDTEDDAELLWGLRGAGNGNFGVIVELRLKVYQHPAFLGGVLLYPATETEQVLNGLSKLFNDKGHPRNFGGEFALLHVPGFGAVFHLIFTWAEPWVDKANPLADGWEWLHNCEALGTVLLNTVTETTPSSIANSLEAAVSNPVHVEFQALSVAGFTPELASILATSLPPGPLGMITVHNCHGAAIHPETIPHPDITDSTASCMAMRYPHLVVAMQGCVAPPVNAADLAQAQQFQDEVAEMARWTDLVVKKIKMAGLSTPRTYVNWTSNEDAVTVKLYGEAASKRLLALKKTYDQANLFSAAYPSLI